MEGGCSSHAAAPGGPEDCESLGGTGIFKMDTEEFFNSADLDRSGSLSRAEVKVALESAKLPVTEQLLDTIFDHVDTAGDGRISKEEFKAYAKNQDRHLADVFRQLDASRTGYIERGDIVHALSEMGWAASQAGGTADALLARMDLLDDDRISYEEFVGFYYLVPAHVLMDTFDAFAKSSLDLGGDLSSVPPPKGGASTSPLAIFISGAIAGACSRTATAPLDRLKVLMQAHTTGRACMFQVAREMYAQDSVRGLFQGNATNVLKIAPESALKFLMYDQMRTRLSADPANPTTLERLASGALAGAISQTAIYPLEITKTRLALACPGTYHSIYHCMSTIIKREGYFALFKGLGASLLGILPYAAIDLGLYNWLRDRYVRQNSQQPSTSTVLACGAASGIAGQLVTYPLALVRTRLQSQGLPGAPRGPEYRGIWDCMTQTVRTSGPLGLYQGLLPNFMKSVPAVCISYAVFEDVKERLHGL